MKRQDPPAPGDAEGHVWVSPWFLGYFSNLGLLTLEDLPIALAGRASHKAGTRNPFIRHTAWWLVATSAEVVGSLARNVWVVREDRLVLILMRLELGECFTHSSAGFFTNERNKTKFSAISLLALLPDILLV